MRVSTWSFLGASLCPAAAFAFTCTQAKENDLVSVHWENRVIPYAIVAPGPGGVDPLAFADVVRASFDAWTAAECSDVRFEMQPVIEEGVGVENRVLALKTGWPHNPEAVALTTVLHSSLDGSIERARIELNDDLFDFTTSSEGCEIELYDLGSVLTHEVGHFLGIGHTQDALVLGQESDPTMTAVVEPCDERFRSLERDDIEAVCFVYPIGGPSQRCAALPVQGAPYVQSSAFGCSSVTGSDASGLLALLFLLRRRSRTVRPCPNAGDRR